LRWRYSRAQQQIPNAVAHLFCGFVGESDSENRFGRHSIGDEVCHSVGNRTGLARTGAGEDQHRPFYTFDSKALFRVQLVKKSQHLSAVFEKCLHKSW
jgi:hypothetical protein